MFDGVENRIAQLMFAVPAVKGIEFGAGFAAAGMRGSENNDEFCLTEGQIRTRSNHAGGILGGITDGEEIVFRTAFKPTPSISRPQRSVNLETMREETLAITGRHDPCIVPRAVPVVEAAAAIALSDLILGGKKAWN
jgi:chorismate synthase